MNRNGLMPGTESPASRARRKTEAGRPAGIAGESAS
jgi:hypothetical protein